MIEVQTDVARFLADIQRGASRLETAAQVALDEATDIALGAAKATTSFKDGPEENRKKPHLRDTIVCGSKGKWARFIKAGAKHALFVEKDTKPHVIEARKGKALRFVVAGSVRFAKRVHHPGTKGTHFMERAGEVGEAALQHLLEEAANRAFQ